MMLSNVFASLLHILNWMLINSNLQSRHLQLLDEFSRFNNEPEVYFKLGQFYRYEFDCVANHCEFHPLHLYSKARYLVIGGSAVTFDYPGMLNDLGLMLSEIGDVQESIQCYEEALSMSPSMIPVLANLAGLHSSMFNVQEAERLYSQAIQASNGNVSPVLLYNFGVFKYGLNDVTSAVELWSESVRLDSTMYLSLGNLATFDCSQDDLTESRRKYELAIKLALAAGDLPGASSLNLQMKLGVVPVISMSKEHIFVSRQEYALSSGELLTTSPRDSLSDPLKSIGCTCIGYYIIYHGFEDLYLRQLQSRVFWRMGRSALKFTAAYLQPSHESSRSAHTHVNILQQQASHSRLIRVGFMSAFFFHHSVGLLLRGVIKRLDRSRFDVTVITLNQPSSKHDYLTKEVSTVDSKQGSDAAHSKVVHLMGTLDKLRRAVADMELDVLVIGELGMDVTTYFMAFSRLARRSVVFWGHAISSGIIADDDLAGGDKKTQGGPGGPDYFVSSAIFESSAAAACSVNTMASAASASELPYLDERDLCGEMGDLAFRSQSESQSESQQSQQYPVVSPVEAWGLAYAQLEYSERLVLMDGMTSYFERPPPPLSAEELNSSAPHQHNPATDISVMEPEKSTASTDTTSASATAAANGIDDNVLPKWYSQLPSKREFLIHLDQNLSSVLTPAGVPFRLYSVPQTLYKLHPDFDLLLLDVLLADLHGFIAFPRGNEPAWSRRVSDRLSRTFAVELEARGLLRSSEGLGSMSQLGERSGGMLLLVGGGERSLVSVESLIRRILFVRHMSEREYLTLCAVSDVVLDPFPVGGGRSSFEIFSVGTPIILLRPRTNILQLTYGMYKAMGLGRTRSCCVAYTSKQYVEMAVTIANDAAQATTLRQAILQRGHALYENSRIVSEWEKMLEYIASTPRPVKRALSVRDVSTADLQTAWQRIVGTVNSTSWQPPSTEKTTMLSEYDLLWTKLQWREDELRQVRLTHPEPPILLRASDPSSTCLQMWQNDDNDGEVGSMEGIHDNRGLQLCRQLQSSALKGNKGRFQDALVGVFSSPDLSSAAVPQDPIIAKEREKETNGRSMGVLGAVDAHFRHQPIDIPMATIAATGTDAVAASAAAAAPTTSTTAAAHAKLIENYIVMANTSLSPRYLYRVSFTHTIGYKPPEELVVTVHPGEDWRQTCINQARDFGMDNKLKFMLVCSLVGKGVERISKPEIDRLNVLTESGKLLFTTIIKEGDEIGQALMFLQQFHNQPHGAQQGLEPLTNEALEQMGSFIRSSQLTLSLASSDSYVLYRQSVVNEWLYWLQNRDRIGSTSHTVNYVPAIDGFDFLNDAECRRWHTQARAKAKAKERLTESAAPSELPGANRNHASTQEGVPEAAVKLADPGSVSIVLGMTTCKRLAHFITTVDALQAALGDLPNSLITKVIIVDDNSSPEDRAAMQERYPRFHYIWKSTTAKRGHASSMNNLVHAFMDHQSTIDNYDILSASTHDSGSSPLNSGSSLLNGAAEATVKATVKPKSYFLYLEDDWRLLDEPVMHFGLAPLVEGLQEYEGHRNPSKQRFHAFEQILWAAISILSEDSTDEHAKVDGQLSRSSSEYIKSPLTQSLQVHQVLFNEQGSRACAVAENCDDSILGLGGWSRVKSTHLPATEGLGAGSGAVVQIPYSLHEFGVVDSVHAHEGRNHAFSYWPGFSLNPGLWDLHTVYQRLAGCLDQSELGSQTGKEDEIEGNSKGGSSTDGYNSISIGGGQGGDNSGGVGSSNTHVNTSTSSLVNLFSEDDRLFEQRFSVSCHAAGLQMAYLPALFFRHIGDVSAYRLNDMRRPWDIKS